MHNKTSLISVIVPIYNAEIYLSKCIDSIINQTYKNLEIILIDDGSTDNCPLLCDEYAKKDSRIKVIHKTNEGSSSARNIGIKTSIGQYIVFLDSDDYFCDNYCFEKLNNYCLQSDYDFVLFKSQKAFVEKKKFVDYYGDYNTAVFETKDKSKIFKYMVSNHKQLACAWNKIIKKELFLKNDLFFVEGTIGEDIDWIIRLFEYSQNIGVVNEIFHSYRQDVSTSITASKSEKKIWDLFNIIKNIILSKKDNTDNFSQSVLSFMAFEYSILLHNISHFDDIHDFEEIQEFDWILKYSIDKKSILIKYIYQILGFKNTIKILSKVSRFL